MSWIWIKLNLTVLSFYLTGLNSGCTPSGSGHQAEISKIIDKYTLLEDVENQQKEQKQGSKLGF